MGLCVSRKTKLKMESQKTINKIEKLKNKKKLVTTINNEQIIIQIINYVNNLVENGKNGMTFIEYINDKIKNKKDSKGHIYTRINCDVSILYHNIEFINSQVNLPIGIKIDYYPFYNNTTKKCEWIYTLNVRDYKLFRNDEFNE